MDSFYVASDYGDMTPEPASLSMHIELAKNDCNGSTPKYSLIWVLSLRLFLLLGRNGGRMITIFTPVPGKKTAVTVCV